VFFFLRELRDTFRILAQYSRVGWIGRGGSSMITTRSLLVFVKDAVCMLIITNGSEELKTRIARGMPLVDEDMLRKDLGSEW
jgi:hypothetical protein